MLFNAPFSEWHSLFTLYSSQYHLHVYCIFCVLLLFMTMTHLISLATFNSQLHAYVWFYFI